MRHAYGNANSNCHIHSDGNSHVYSDGNCHGNVYANSNGNNNCFANGNCESDRTTAAFTDATASADAAAACEQLLRQF
jgi:hypothetical protein